VAERTDWSSSSSSNSPPLTFPQWIAIVSAIVQHSFNRPRNGNNVPGLNALKPEVVDRRASAVTIGVVAAFVGALGLLAAIGLLTLWNVERIYQTNALVANSYTVRESLDALVTTLIDAETGQRGYVITGEAAYLEPYTAAQAVVDARIRTLLRLTAADPDQVRDVGHMSTLANRKLAELAETIRLRRDEGFDVAQSVVKTDAGKRQMDEMRAIAARIATREVQRLADRSADAERSYQTALATGAGSALLAIATLIALFLTTRRNAVERHRSLLETIREREFLRVTLMGIGDGVIVTDAQGGVLLMNPVAESLTGRTLQQATGRLVDEIFVIVNEYTRNQVENPVQKVIKEGTIQGLANHTVLIAADGTERAIDDSGAPIRTLGGTLVGIVLVFRDVTIQRQSASALERALRAAEENGARLEAQESHLREAVRAKDEFLAVVSHELRTPINAVLGWTRMLQDGTVRDERRKGALETIDRNAQSLAKMIEDLVDMARLSSGKMRISVSEIDLTGIARDAIEAVRFSATNKGVVLESMLPNDVPVVLGDADRLKQVIWNLVMNAIKFTPSGGRVKIALTASDGNVQLAVHDTGVGIASEFLPFVFERFRQAEASNERSGLGLGLAISRHLVEMHGGSIEVSSEGRNMGTTFVVTLPAVGTAAPTGGLHTR
jgi:PAS domain S-box-containing protein